MTQQIDEISPVAAYITAEMCKNASGWYATYMRQLNSPTMADLAYDLGKNKLGMPESLTLRVLAALSGNPTAISGRILALYMWYDKVNYKHEWDHKPKIKKLFPGTDAKRGFQWQRYGARDFNYDIWSNIHYGYVGKACGFSNEVLLAGAGAVQRDTAGTLNIRNGKCVITQPADCDDPKDQSAIRLGFSLYASKPTSFLFPDLIRKVIAWPNLNVRPVAAFDASLQSNPFGSRYA